MTPSDQILTTIQKKLVGKELHYKEIYQVMDEISHNRLGNILTTYFAAAGYSTGFSDEELYLFTKAMVETGEKLHFPGIVADKHSIGGVPGTRTTLIVVPIIAAAGFCIPKSSSRAITTPGGTADDMEVLAPVSFSKKQIYDIIEKVNGCVIWGGSVNIAPADDVLIRVEQPLLFESFDKIIVSIMAKKVAFGATHVVIDVPYGPSVKVHKKEDALQIQKKFLYVAKRFNIKMHVFVHRISAPVGRGIGPILEVKEALKVLEQTTDAPMDLQEHALTLAGALLDLCLVDASKSLRTSVLAQYENGYTWAKHILESGQAAKKMTEIIKAQGGDATITSKKLHPSHFSSRIIGKKRGTIKKIDSHNATKITKILGAPHDKGAGIFFSKKVGDTIEPGEVLYTIYSSHQYNIKEAKESIKNFPLIFI